MGSEEKPCPGESCGADGDDANAVSLDELTQSLVELVRRCFPARVVSVTFGGDARPAAETTARGPALSQLLLDVSGAPIGWLTIASDDGPLGDDEARTLVEIARHVAVLAAAGLRLVRTSTFSSQLQRGLASREVIGQATGILMHCEGCTRDHAFDILRRASQRENRKLREIAEELVLRVEGRASQPDRDYASPNGGRP
jgi:hypothetical protein